MAAQSIDYKGYTIHVDEDKDVYFKLFKHKLVLNLKILESKVDVRALQTITTLITSTFNYFDSNQFALSSMNKQIVRDRYAAFVRNMVLSNRHVISTLIRTRIESAIHGKLTRISPAHAKRKSPLPRDVLFDTLKHIIPSPLRNTAQHIHTPTSPSSDANTRTFLQYGSNATQSTRGILKIIGRMFDVTTLYEETNGTDNGKQIDHTGTPMYETDNNPHIQLSIIVIYIPHINTHHANAIIYNTDTRHMIHFEPHGCYSDSGSIAKTTCDYVKTMAQDMGYTLDTSSLRLQGQEPHCLFWSLLFIIYYCILSIHHGKSISALQLAKVIKRHDTKTVSLQRRLNRVHDLLSYYEADDEMLTQVSRSIKDLFIAPHVPLLLSPSRSPSRSPSHKPSNSYGLSRLLSHSVKNLSNVPTSIQQSLRNWYDAPPSIQSVKNLFTVPASLKNFLIAREASPAAVVSSS
jgi:hypothetical protein